MATIARQPTHRADLDCAVAGHRHLAKADAARCLEGHEDAAMTAAGGHEENATASGDYADPGYRPPRLQDRGQIVRISPIARHRGKHRTVDGRDGSIQPNCPRWPSPTIYARRASRITPPLRQRTCQLVDEIVPRLDTLQKRVEEIARTPMPPQTIARVLTGSSKREDAGGLLSLLPLWRPTIKRQ